MTEQDAQQHLASPPAPNIMGQDRMQIIERKWVEPKYQDQKPFEVVTTYPWEIF